MLIAVLLIFALLLRMTGSWKPTLFVVGIVIADVTVNSLFIEWNCSPRDTQNYYDESVHDLLLDDGVDVCADECTGLIFLGYNVHKTIQQKEYRFSFGDRCAPSTLIDYVGPAFSLQDRCFQADEVEPGKVDTKWTIRTGEEYFGRVRTETTKVEVREAGAWKTTRVNTVKRIKTITPIAWFLSDIDQVACVTKAAD